MTGQRTEDPAAGAGRDPSPLPAVVRSALRIVPWVMFAIVVLLVVWTTVLASTLHGRTFVRNWSATWIGLDLAEATMLALTAFLLLRRSRMLSPVAAITATLFVVDAWFDVMTSANGSGWYESVVSAILIEIPAALALGALSWWSMRSSYFIDKHRVDKHSVAQHSAADRSVDEYSVDENSVADRSGEQRWAPQQSSINGEQAPR